MTYVKVKGFKIYLDRTGRMRCYHRKSSLAIDLVASPLGSASFFAECEAITRATVRNHSPKPGTLGLLIAEYQKHDAFLTLKSRTRADYRRCFDYLSDIGDAPLSRFKSSLVVGIRDKAAKSMGRKWGNYVKTCLSLLFSWGIERGYVETNPAKGVRQIKRDASSDRANRPWADHERRAVMDALPPQLKLPFALMAYCGLDPIDVRTLPKTAVRNGMINTRRNKTQVPLWVRIPAPALAIIEATPHHSAMTLCATSRGTPWTKTGMETSWAVIRRRLEATGDVQPRLTMKGLRHTVATILAEINYDGRTIADMLGQKTTAMGEHYSSEADKARKMDSVVTNFEAELARRANKTV